MAEKIGWPSAIITAAENELKDIPFGEKKKVVLDFGLPIGLALVTIYYERNKISRTVNIEGLPPPISISSSVK